MNTYDKLKTHYTQLHKKAKKQSDLIAALRMGCTLLGAISIYQYGSQRQPIFLFVVGLAALIFLILVRWHGKATFNKNFHEQLVRINREEIESLKHHDSSFEDGAEFLTEDHPYAHDLDVFGKNSLFQHLNRTGLHIGKKTLAKYFLSRPDVVELLSRQEAIEELKGKINWRQHFLALAYMHRDHQDFYKSLISWSHQKSSSVSSLLRMILYLTPATLAGAIGLYLYSSLTLYANLASLIFLTNLLLLSFFLGKIKRTLLRLDHVRRILSQYSLLIEKVERTSFEANKLKDLQNRLKNTRKPASTLIKKLSRLYHNLESVQNPMGAILFNGVFLYHLRLYGALMRWKREFSHLIPDWLKALGEIEALNSLANFAYNHPECHFPILNNQLKINFEGIGHPLIPREKRICNDVSFERQRFIILTGSNMSGKSTFLRTLGINLILAWAGAPICARKADIHPLNIFVSMKSSDSLAKNESYFLAEIKRLAQLTELLEKEPCFALLDEILRGTNSDDKRSGTIGMIKTLVKKDAFGAIATHDLEVCQITLDHPKTLANQCFEVDIKKNELIFDYRLREGVCRNKSASFLLNKMGIISTPA